MYFETENILWFFTTVMLLQLVKLVYHGHSHWKMQRKKLKFNKEWKQLKSFLLPNEKNP